MQSPSQDFIQALIDGAKPQLSLSIFTDDIQFVPKKLFTKNRDEHKKIVLSSVYESSGSAKKQFVKEHHVHENILNESICDASKHIAKASLNKGILECVKKSSMKRLFDNLGTNNELYVVLGLAIITEYNNKDKGINVAISVIDTLDRGVTLISTLSDKEASFFSKICPLILSRYVQEYYSYLNYPIVSDKEYIDAGITIAWEDIKSVASLKDHFDAVLSGKNQSLFLYPSKGAQHPLDFIPFTKEHKGFEVVVLCGSFNPLHLGHEAIINFSADYVKRIHNNPELEVLKVCEISVKNADKGTITEEAVMNRVRQFANTVKGEEATVFNDFNNRDGPYSCMLLNPEYSLFSKKSHILKNCYLALGYDTAIRLVDTKYYNNSQEILYSHLLEMQRNGIKIIVFGRLNSTGAFEDFGTHHKELPVFLRDMFHVITEKEFRFDLSSTYVRNNMKKI